MEVVFMWGFTVFCCFQYVHYQIDYPEEDLKTQLMKKEAQLSMSKSTDLSDQVNMFPPQVSQRWPILDIAISPFYSLHCDLC